MEQLAPYAAAGLPALQQIQQLSTLEGQNSGSQSVLKAQTSINSWLIKLFYQSL